MADRKLMGSDSGAGEKGSTSKKSTMDQLLIHIQLTFSFPEGFAISPRSCRVAGESGTCMFVWECLKTDGQHLGMCMDGFMFGSCCVHDAEDNEVKSDLKPYDSNDEKEEEEDKAVVVVKSSSTTEAAPFSKLPTRPARPSKPHKKAWPQKHVYGSKRKKRPPRPSKAPPSKSWSWDEDVEEEEEEDDNAYFPSSPPSIFSTSTISKFSTASAKPFFPEDSTENALKASGDDGGTTEWTSLKVRPTRPTRPPKPGSGVTYFPQSALGVAETKVVFSRTTFPTTTTSTTTTRTTTTTTTSTTTTTRRTSTTSKPRPPRVPEPTKGNSGPTSVSAGPRAGTCGVPQIQKDCPKGRIVNGTQSCYGQFPWQVRKRGEDERGRRTKGILFPRTSNLSSPSSTTTTAWGSAPRASLPAARRDFVPPSLASPSADAQKTSAAVLAAVEAPLSVR